MSRVLRGRGPRVRILSLPANVLAQEPWELLRFPAIAEEDEAITARRSGDRNAFWRRQGEALHPERKLLESLDRIRPRIHLSPAASRNELRCDPSPLPGLRISETRET